MRISQCNSLSSKLFNDSYHSKRLSLTTTFTSPSCLFTIQSLQSPKSSPLTPLNSNLITNPAIAIFNSATAKCRPIQSLLPKENGTQQSSLVFSPNQRSGMNFSGAAKTTSFIWIIHTLEVTLIPPGTCKPSILAPSRGVTLGKRPGMRLPRRRTSFTTAHKYFSFSNCARVGISAVG